MSGSKGGDGKGNGPDAAKPIVDGPVGPSTDGAAPEPDPAIAALKAEHEALKAELAAQKAALEMVGAELSAEREQRAEEVIATQERMDKAAAALDAAVKLTGFVQADYGAWRQSSEDQLNASTGDPLNEERFLIRRARLRASIERGWVAGALELDGNTVRGTTARLVGAEASLRWPTEHSGDPSLLMLTMGLFKIPFGFEVIESDRDRLFLERSTAERALFPGEYDLGARLQGGWRFLRYALAVQNGEPLGEKALPGRDPNAAKDVTGRLGVETPLSDGVLIAGGFSALSGTGFHPGTPATKPTVQWTDRNENGAFDSGELTTSPGVSATPSRNFGRFGYGADLRLSVTIPGVGTTTAYGEVYWAKNLDRAILPADPLGPLGRDARELGAYAALIQEIGHNLMVGARYDYYDPDLDSANRSMGVLVPTSFSYQTLAAVVAVRLPSGRLTVEYDHNRNNLGRDATGAPTNLKDDALIVRGQASF